MPLSPDSIPEHGLFGLHDSFVANQNLTNQVVRVRLNDTQGVGVAHAALPALHNDDRVTSVKDALRNIVLASGITTLPSGTGLKRP